MFLEQCYIFNIIATFFINKFILTKFFLKFLSINKSNVWLNLTLNKEKKLFLLLVLEAL